MLTLKFILTFVYIINNSENICGAGAPSYVVTAPKIVKQWTNYNVMISLHNVPSVTNITLKIDGTNGLNASKTQLLQPISGTVTQLFQMGFDSQWKNGEYKLHAIGAGGIVFTKEFSIRFVNKHYVILIQSDSPIYRPGDTINFRAIILDDNLRPVINKYIEDMKIFVKDPINRKKCQFFIKTGELGSSEIYGTNFFNISKGVTNDISLLLSDDESVGKWTIEVQLSGQIQSYNFYVDRYRNTLGTVDIKVPEFKTYVDPILPINVNCFYTFGKPVNGLATVLISKYIECGNKVPKENITHWSNNYNISGQLNEQIDFRDTQLFNYNCESSFNLTVIVYDFITKQEYVNYKIIEFHQQSIIAKNMNPLQKIKPGHNFRVLIKFFNIEGNEVDVNKLNELQFEAKIILNNNSPKNAIPMAIEKKNNNMVLDFQTDAQTKLLNLLLKLEDSVIANYTYNSYTACKQTLIQLQLQESLRHINVDDVINLIVTGTEAIDYLSLYFLVRGDIINSSSITFANPNNVVLVPLLMKKEMAPDVTVVVYYYSKTTGILAFDSLNIQIDGLFQNDIKIKLENTSLDVSQTAKFSIQTQPDSQLLLLGIDKAVVRENMNSFITESFVIDLLNNVQETKNVANGDISTSINFGSNAIPQCSTYYNLQIIESFDDLNHDEDVVNIRNDYRKTWIWDRTYVSAKGLINLSAELPDSITSWQLSAISLHDEKGLGITSVPVQITAFRSLFVELKLPYSIIRHEKTEIQVMVFNYLTETAQIEISVEQNLNYTLDLSLYSCKGNITVKSNEIQIFTCYITARDVGIAQLKVRAQAKSKSNVLLTDGEVQSVIVKYEGVVINEVKEIYLDFTNEEMSNNSIKELFNIEMPSNKINGSQKVYAMAKSETSDQNWHKLLKQIIVNPVNFAFPALTTTCNLRMTAFAQQIFQLNYLKIVNKSDKSVIDGIIANLQNCLSRKCSQFPDDGSIVSPIYSGNNPTAVNQAKSSTWMTAYFIKSLLFMKNYVNINKNTLYYTTAWLKRQQISNGEFLETDPTLMFRPNVGHYGLYLTSFAYIALESDINQIEPNQNAVSYVSQLYPTINNNTYDSIIACYVFHLSKHQSRDQCFDDIIKKSVKINDLRYWLGIDGKPDIDATSYGLLILVKRKSYSIAFNIFKYLKSIQTANGMVGDTFQTSIALEAMTALIKSFNNFGQKTQMMNIEVNDGQSKHRMVIRPENEITQIWQLSDQSKQIDLTANGYGSAVFKIVSQYNILGPIGSAFNTSVLNTNSSDSYVNLTVCTRYNLEGSADDVVIEIDLPTGYKYDANGVQNTNASIESINDDTHVNIFVKQLKLEEICINVPAIQSFKTIDAKPVPIKVYPKNDKSKLTVHELIF